MILTYKHNCNYYKHAQISQIQTLSSRPSRVMNEPCCWLSIPAKHWVYHYVSQMNDYLEEIAEIKGIHGWSASPPRSPSRKAPCCSTFPPATPPCHPLSVPPLAVRVSNQYRGSSCEPISVTLVVMIEQRCGGEGSGGVEAGSYGRRRNSRPETLMIIIVFSRLQPTILYLFMRSPWRRKRTPPALRRCTRHIPR